jgi:tRNA-2-methylthio-N6-dimethylallyladenosine synthase
MNNKEVTKKKVFLRTFGCQMNVRDSEIILGMLEKRGYALAESEEAADIILFNTCSVRQHAEHRVWSNVGRLKRTTEYGRRNTKTIGIVGCMAQNYQHDIFKRFPYVNLVCGPANIYDIPDLLEKVVREKAQVLAVDEPSRPLHSDGGGLRLSPVRAFVSIMYGCDNFCSYCIVPFVRGRERSRPVKHILDEVSALAQKGCREITLLGQNVNSYGKNLRAKIDFAKLLEELNKINNIARIDFMTSHPKDVSLRLFRAIRDLPSVSKHLHLPLQSGSNKILRLMNRGYTLGDYLKRVRSLRRLVPNVNLTTDIIVGFPGETKEDFNKTYQAMRKIQFDAAFIFKYSPRPKTKASRLKDSVPHKEKQRRNNSLLKLQRRVLLNAKKT